LARTIRQALTLQAEAGKLLQCAGRFYLMPVRITLTRPRRAKDRSVLAEQIGPSETYLCSAQGKCAVSSFQRCRRCGYPEMSAFRPVHSYDETEADMHLLLTTPSRGKWLWPASRRLQPQVNIAADRNTTAAGFMHNTIEFQWAESIDRTGLPERASPFRPSIACLCGGARGPWIFGCGRCDRRLWLRTEFCLAA